MVKFVKIAYIFLALSIAVNIEAQNTYGSRLLETMAQKLQIKEQLDTLSDGVYPDLIFYKKPPVTVRVTGGKVTHLGYKVFSEAYRQQVPSPIYDFLERYALQDALSLIKSTEKDHVKFRVGKLSSLPQYGKDSTLNLRTNNIDERLYVVSWGRNGNTVGDVEFPSDYELMLGTSQDELLSNFQYAVENTTDSITFVQPDTTFLVKEDPELGDYYVYKDGYSVIDEIANKQFYVIADTCQGSFFKPLYSRDYPIESVCNLIALPGIANDYVADVKYRKSYNDSNSFVVPFRQLMAFFRQDGCKPYMGVRCYNPDNQLLVMYVRMRNHEYAYEHWMRMTFDIGTLTERKGVIKVKINGLYQPTHNVKNRRVNKW